MKRSTLTHAALAAALFAPAAAQARPPAKIAAEITREVLSATLGEGISQAFAAAMGVGQSAPNAVSLTDEAFTAIGTIIGNALADQDFNSARASATTALQNAEDYRRTLPGDGLSAGAALQTNLTNINTITQGATSAANFLVNTGLRGLPLYQVVQSAALTARDEQIAINPANAANYQSIKDAVVARALAHINGQVDHWSGMVRGSAWPISRVFSHENDCHWLTGVCSKTYYKYCFTGPGGYACSASFRDNGAGKQDDPYAYYNHALRVRSVQLGEASAKAFADIGEVRRAFADHADLATGFSAAVASGYPNATQSGWSDNARYPRLAGDVNGDGNDDIVSFSSINVTVHLATGAGTYAAAPSFTISSGLYTTAWGWGPDHPRFVVDMNGDGYDDIAGFAGNGLYVSLSNGTSFGAPGRWMSECSYDLGWRTSQHVRLVGDVNGDGRGDAICINDGGTHLALNRGDGQFTELLGVTNNFARNYGGWDPARHLRLLGDVNGDGMQDLVGFGDTNVFVALSTGAGFAAPVANHMGFTIDHGAWRVGDHPRYLADMNGDGNDDIVGFGNGGVGVALSNGDGTFSAGQIWSNAFGYDHGWRGNTHLRLLADADGDGDADILASGWSPTVEVYYSE